MKAWLISVNCSYQYTNYQCFQMRSTSMPIRKLFLFFPGLVTHLLFQFKIVIHMTAIWQEIAMKFWGLYLLCLGNVGYGRNRKGLSRIWQIRIDICLMKRAFFRLLILKILATNSSTKWSVFSAHNKIIIFPPILMVFPIILQHLLSVSFDSLSSKQDNMKLE